MLDVESEVVRAQDLRTARRGHAYDFDPFAAIQEDRTARGQQDVLTRLDALDAEPPGEPRLDDAAVGSVAGAQPTACAQAESACLFGAGRSLDQGGFRAVRAATGQRATAAVERVRVDQRVADGGEAEQRGLAVLAESKASKAL